MRAVIRLEVIGENYRHHLRAVGEGKAKKPHLKKYIELLRYGQKKFTPWVARITANGYEFIESHRDYSQANGIGSRGIFEYYALRAGLYEVNACVKLGEMRRYCIIVNDDTTIEEIECQKKSISE